MDFTPVFNWLANAGSVDPQEMLKTFNCGIGMVLIIPSVSKDLVKQMLETFHYQVFEIGIVNNTGEVSFSGELFVTKKVAIFISGSGSNMVSLVNSMYKQNYALPSLVLSNKSCASGLTKAKNFNIPTVCIEPQQG